MPLNAQILLSILAHETSSGDLSRTLRATPASYAATLTDGTGVNQAQIAWSSTRIIGEPEVDDFSLRALTDDRGTIVFSQVAAWYIKNSGNDPLVLGTDAGEESSPDSAWPFWPTRALGGFVLAQNTCLFYCNPNANKASVTTVQHVIRVSGAAGSQYEVVLIGEGTIS